ncbi:MAG: hypothetical protein V3U11_13640, partial [Planctomycetota bacterium]
VAQQARVVSASTDTVPRQALLDAVAEMVGVERRAIVAGDVAVRFLLVGCETEKRILLMATWLRNVLGYQQVGVAAHLVGSSTQEAHFATLRHNLPSAGVRVFLDLEQAASFAGLSPESFAPLGCRPCAIEPQEFREALSENQRRIIELLCMHWTRTEVRPLQGGFSGSLLLLADGWK